MFEKAKIGGEVNLILRSCAFPSSMDRYEIQKAVSEFIPIVAPRMKKERLSVRQATIELICYYVSLTDFDTLAGLQKHAPAKFSGLCCLWRYARTLLSSEPNAYQDHFFLSDQNIDDLLLSGFDEATRLSLQDDSAN